jgi:RNA polymerase sigma-70 factor (ECF subfamily)
MKFHSHYQYRQKIKMDINERALLYRAHTGDRQAAGKLFESYFPDVYSYLYYKVSDQNTAETLSAEVFVRMLRELPDFQDQEKPFISWLYQLAGKIVREHKNNGNGSKESARDLVDAIHSNPDTQRSAEAGVDCFRRAVRHLNARQQAVIIHRFVEGRSLADVADLTNQAEGTVETIQRRALSALERALRKENCL